MTLEQASVANYERVEPAEEAQPSPERLQLLASEVGDVAVENAVDTFEAGTEEPASVSEQVSGNSIAALDPNGQEVVELESPGVQPGRAPRSSRPITDELFLSERRPRQQNPKDEDLVRAYLTDIGRHELLTKEQEVELAQKIERGRLASETLEANAAALDDQARVAYEQLANEGDKAKRQFINANLRLVVSIAKRYQASGLPLLDLIQEGNLGLMHAVDKFEWRKDFKFSTYATWWVRQAIQRGIANTNRTIRIPIHASDEISKLRKVQSRLEQNLGRRPTVPELAEVMEAKEARVKNLLKYAQDTLSLDEPLRNEEDATLGDIVEDIEGGYDEVEKNLVGEQLEQMLAQLNERERAILITHFGLDQGEHRQLKELVPMFKLSRERIRQIEAKALAKLRHRAPQLDLKDFL